MKGKKKTFYHWPIKNRKVRGLRRVCHCCAESTNSTHKAINFELSNPLKYDSIVEDSFRDHSVSLNVGLQSNFLLEFQEIPPGFELSCSGLVLVSTHYHHTRHVIKRIFFYIFRFFFFLNIWNKPSNTSHHHYQYLFENFTSIKCNPKAKLTY